MSHKHKWYYPADPLERMKGIHGLYRKCRCGVSQRYSAVVDFNDKLTVQNSTTERRKP